MLLGHCQIREVQPLVILTAMVTLVRDPISHCVPYCLRELTSTLPPLRSGAKKDLLVFATTEALILLNDGTGNFTNLEGDVDFEGYDGTCFDASGDGRMSIWTTQMESNVYYYIGRGSWPIELHSGGGDASSYRDATKFMVPVDVDGDGDMVRLSSICTGCLSWMCLLTLISLPCWPRI